MVTRGSWTRRSFLTAVGTVALGTKGLSGAVAAPYVLQKGSKLTYWGGLIFSDKANKLLVETVNNWGAENGIATEVVMINQNETVQKVSAAVASNTMPDALDLEPRPAAAAVAAGRASCRSTISTTRSARRRAAGSRRSPRPPTPARSRAAAPAFRSACQGNLLLRRNDLLEKAGFAKPPATWEELVQQAAAVNKPPLFGLGLALSNVGDGNVQVSVLQSYGGRIADDAGTKAAIKSEETRDYLRWVKDAWDKKVFPPGNTTWDGAGDNQAYLSGQAAFIANTGSVGIAAKTQDPELFKATAYSSLPAGPKGVVSPIQPQRARHPQVEQEPGSGQGAASSISPQPAFMNAYYDAAIYGPVLKDQAKFKAFDGRTRSSRACSTSSRTARRRAIRTSTTRPTPTCGPTSSSRRWCSASSSTAGTSTAPWTRRRRRPRRSTTSTNRQSHLTFGCPSSRMPAPSKLHRPAHS